MKQAIIIFTRVPIPGKTKTRLMPFLSAQECADLHKCFILDVYHTCVQTDADVLVCYTPDESRDALAELFDGEPVFLPQRGLSMGERMAHAFSDAFSLGYEKALLVGTDIPQLTAEHLGAALEALSGCDVVIAPTLDGGYYLIGMKEEHPGLWDIPLYGTSTVFSGTLEQAEKAGLTAAVGQMCRDIDTKEDLLALYTESAQLTGHTVRYLRHLRHKLHKLKEKPEQHE